jgi:hypothetical protein
VNLRHLNLVRQPREAFENLPVRNGLRKCLLWDQTRKWALVTAMSAFPPITTKLRTSREVRFVPILLQKSVLWVGTQILKAVGTYLKMMWGAKPPCVQTHARFR